jgi:hypothetical protein
VAWKSYYYESGTTFEDKSNLSFQIFNFKTQKISIVKFYKTQPDVFSNFILHWVGVFVCPWYSLQFYVSFAVQNLSTFFLSFFFRRGTLWVLFMLIWFLALCSVGLFNWEQRSVSHRNCWNSCWRHPHGLNTSWICSAFKICSLFTLFPHRSWCSRSCY